MLDYNLQAYYAGCMNQLFQFEPSRSLTPGYVIPAFFFEDAVKPVILSIMLDAS